MLKRSDLFFVYSLHTPFGWSETPLITVLVIKNNILNAVGESLKEPNIDSLHSKQIKIKISELNCGFSVLPNV